MFSRLLVIALIVAIQACPFYCRATSTKSVSDAKSATCPCCAARNAAADPCGDSSDWPSEPTQGGKSLHCVCAGAVIEKCDPFLPSVEQAFAEIVPTAESAPAIQLANADAPRQFLRCTPGRQICCLTMSFLR